MSGILFRKVSVPIKVSFKQDNFPDPPSAHRRDSYKILCLFCNFQAPSKAAILKHIHECLDIKKEEEVGLELPPSLENYRSRASFPNLTDQERSVLNTEDHGLAVSEEDEGSFQIVEHSAQLRSSFPLIKEGLCEPGMAFPTTLEDQQEGPFQIFEDPKVTSSQGHGLSELLSALSVPAKDFQSNLNESIPQDSVSKGFTASFHDNPDSSKVFSSDLPEQSGTQNGQKEEAKKLGAISSDERVTLKDYSQIEKENKDKKELDCIAKLAILKNYGSKLFSQNHPLSHLISARKSSTFYPKTYFSK